jgi:hypothetical protein
MGYSQFWANNTLGMDLFLTDNARYCLRTVNEGGVLEMIRKITNQVRLSRPSYSTLRKSLVSIRINLCFQPGIVNKTRVSAETRFRS